MISGRGCEAIGQDLIQPQAFSASTLTGAAAAFTSPARTRSLPLLRELMRMIHAHECIRIVHAHGRQSQPSFPPLWPDTRGSMHRSRRAALAIAPSGVMRMIHAHDLCASLMRMAVRTSSIFSGPRRTRCGERQP
jgi:hypothetical protein